MHWGWYWKVKRAGHITKDICEAHASLELDSFSIFNDYKRQIEPIRATRDKIILHIPTYKLKAYLQDNDDLWVAYSKGINKITYTIPVERKPCNYGGYYYFFHCPKCRKRSRKLYCFDGQYLCRKCGKLSYYSQGVRPTTRLILQHGNKITDKIKRLGGDIGTDLKPPRMHQKTFEAYKRRSEYLLAKYALAGINELRSWHGPNATKHFDSYFEWEANYIISEYKERRSDKSSI